MGDIIVDQFGDIWVHLKPRKPNYELCLYLVTKKIVRIVSNWY